MLAFGSELAGRVDYTHAVLYVALDDHGAIHDSLSFGRLDFVSNEAKPSPLAHDYGDFRLIRKVLSVEDALTLLSGIRNGSIDIDGRQIRWTRSQANEQHRFVPSDTSYSYVSSDYPVHLIFTNASGSRISYEPLAVRPDLPMYPSRRQAIVDFMGLTQQSDFNAEFIVMFHEPRSKILQVSVKGKEVVAVIVGKLPESDLTVKMYVTKSNGEREASPGISVEKASAAFTFGFEPDTVDCALVIKSTAELIDRKSTSEWGQRGIIFQIPENQLRDMIAAGESSSTEFKTSIDNTNDLLETVVSFANGKGGSIIVGVEDRKNEVVGFHASDKRSVENSINSRVNNLCEPNIEIKTEWPELDGRPLFLIKVTEGTDKPYNVRRLGIFVRDNKDDNHISRQQLDSIYREKNRVAQGIPNNVI